jgi:hypothetical protein
MDMITTNAVVEPQTQLGAQQRLLRRNCGILDCKEGHKQRVFATYSYSYKEYTVYILFLHKVCILFSYTCPTVAKKQRAQSVPVPHIYDAVSFTGR